MQLVTDTISWLLYPASWSGNQGIVTRLIEHAAFSGISIAVAMAIAIPVGVWIGHTGRFASVGSNLAIPNGATVIDLGPFIIDLQG